ncbi:serine/threonine-protein kinase SMG1-like [Amblyomma americanum]
MRKAAQTVGSLDATLHEAREGHLALAGAVEQRLKWAGGANPALADTRTSFTHLVAQWTDPLQALSTIASEVYEASDALLLHESLRTRTTEALSWDARLLGLLNRCQESCMLAEGASAPLSPAEQQLLQLQGGAPLPAEASVEWLRSLLDKVALSACREQLEQAKTSRDTCREALQNQVSTLRADVLGKHHELLSELRSLLKSLARHEDVAVQEYLATYRKFSERASELVRTLLAPDATPSDSVQEALSELIAMVPRVYQGLTELASAQDGLDQPKNATLSKSVEQTPDRKVNKDPRT